MGQAHLCGAVPLTTKLVDMTLSSFAALIWSLVIGTKEPGVNKLNLLIMFGLVRFKFALVNFVFEKIISLK